MKLAIEKLLGSGSFGVVFRCVTPEGTRVAVKRVSRGCLIVPAEVTVAQAVRHKNVLPVQTIFATKSHERLIMSIVTPLCTCDAAKLIATPLKEGRRLSADCCARKAIDVAVGLQALHKAGYVHRDAKAQNFMIRISQRGGGYKVVALVGDLGSARRINPLCYPYASPKSIRTPEQWVGIPFSFASDTFALGTFLLHLIHARPRIATFSECIRILPKSGADEFLKRVDASIADSVKTLVKEAGRDREPFEQIVKELDPERAKLGRLALKCLDWEESRMSLDDVCIALQEEFPKLVSSDVSIDLYE